jgi:hypothetical protein
VLRALGLLAEDDDMVRRLALSALLALACFATKAYEVDTHAMITSYAFDRSTLTSSELVERIGIDRFNDARPFTVPTYVTYSGARAAYLDFQQADWDGAFSLSNRRPIQEYDWRNMFSKPGESFRTNADEQAKLKA